MKWKSFEHLVSDLFAECRAVLREKRGNYSILTEDDDAFKAFNEGVDIRENFALGEMDREQSALYEVTKKLQRMANAGHGLTKTEGVRNWVVDAINFILLYYGMWMETEELSRVIDKELGKEFLEREKKQSVRPERV